MAGPPATDALPSVATSAGTSTGTAVYRLIGPLPTRLRFRNGTVTLEVARDCAATVPTWVFRAVRVLPGAGGREPISYRIDGLSGCRLPTVAPIQRAMSLQAARQPHVVIASSTGGRKALEQMLRAGVTLDRNCGAGRVMEALVRMGYAAVAGSASPTLGNQCQK